MASTKLNVDGMMLLEQPFARVPYENYRKVFRANQRALERELTAVQTTSSDLSKRAKNGTSNSDDALKSVDGMIGRVENLKRKLSDLQESAGKPTQAVMRERLNHLAAVDDFQGSSDPQFSRWADTRLDRWLVDWALRNGKERTAKKIATEKHIETLVDIDLFTDIHRIEDALSKYSCTEALAWCSENKSALRKLKSTLEFELRMQEYIELARARKSHDAIAYSKKHLISWQDTHLAEIRQASALLAFPPHTQCGPYKRLYDLSRWPTLVQSFRLAIYTLNSLPTEPLLHLALYAGLASLKLPTCYDHDHEGTKNIDCPVCDSGFGKLAEEVPFSHHANSTIVCRISGRIIDGDNMPLAFPNGQVYSREALEQMNNGGNVTCPTTGKTVQFSELRKVFIS